MKTLTIELYRVENEIEGCINERFEILLKTAILSMFAFIKIMPKIKVEFVSTYQDFHAMFYSLNKHSSHYHN